MSTPSGPLVAGPGYNAEEAAHIASEFLASLDNLPGEVVFLLEEIREKDQRISQLVTRIHTRHLGLTKHLRSIVSTPGTATPSNTPLPGPAGSAIAVAHLTPKDAAAVAKIQNEWAKVEALQNEKVILAERMERIVGRAKERGKEEWRKMGGEDVDAAAASGDGVWKAEMSAGEIILPPGGLGGGGERSNKKRRPAHLPLALPTPTQSMPPPLLPSARPPASNHSTYRKPLTSRKRYSTSVSDADGEEDEPMEFGDPEADAEGEAEGDDQLYCTCQQKSYGEMIGCDNEKCPYEWFHLKCVNIVGQPPETWFCPTCVQKLGFISSDGTKAPGSASIGGRGERDKKSRKR